MTPIASLVERLGATVFMHDMMDDEKFWLKLTCVAPDEDRANFIERMFNAFHNLSADEIEEQQIPRVFWFVGKLYRNGLELEFHIDEIMELSRDLPVMLAYLREQGCTRIEYQPVKGRP
jgi:hypothetical protein